MPEVRVPYPVIEIDGIDERSADGRRDRARSGICRNGPAEHADNAQIGGQPPLTLPEVPNAGVLPTATIDFDEVAVEVRMDRDVPTTDSVLRELATAFEHATIGNFVAILINVAHSNKTVALEGTSLPAELDAHVTSATRILGGTGTRTPRHNIVLPPRSVTTLIDGSFLDAPERVASPPGSGAPRPR